MAILTTIYTWVKDFFYTLDPRSIVDILIVTVVIYQLIKLTRQTRAYQVLKGFAFIIVAAQVCKWFNLTVLSWLFDTLLNTGAVVLVVLFQPEFRRALEKLGRGKILTRLGLGSEPDEITNRTVDEIIRSVRNMSKKQTGALMVIQDKSSLHDIIEGGTVLDARVASALLENLFFHNAPLHDGAVIIHGDRILAAGCLLPISENPDIDQELGMRHRSAISMSELSDAIIIIVSEETGLISVAHGGKLTRYREAENLRKWLTPIYGAAAPSRLSELKRRVMRHDK